MDLDLAALTRCTAFLTRSSLKLFSPTRNFTSPSSSAATHFKACTFSPLRTSGSAWQALPSPQAQQAGNMPQLEGPMRTLEQAPCLLKGEGIGDLVL